MADWKVEHLDQANSIEQSLEHEVKRLMVLKSYMALDVDCNQEIIENDEEKDHVEEEEEDHHHHHHYSQPPPHSLAGLHRLTALAAHSLHAPVSFVALVDLGRVWFLSRRGSLLQDCCEATRRTTFCAHACLTTQRIFVVPDATKDERFQHNPLVQRPPPHGIRFYAAAPLRAPEGVTLGVYVCIGWLFVVCLLFGCCCL